jgi:hypothetical protein
MRDLDLRILLLENYAKNTEYLITDLEACIHLPGPEGQAARAALAQYYTIKLKENENA